jgi:hypothetical protein
MYPLHKEKYYVSKDTFYHFMYDRHADVFKKEKRESMIYAITMAFCLVAVTIVNIISPSAKGDYVWMVLPVVFAILCFSFVKKYQAADRVTYNKIMKDYASRKYEEKQITVKFYEDKLTYSWGSELETYEYKEFKKFYEGPDYFALYFHNGALVLMSDKCKVEKIKEIMAQFKENFVKAVAEE